MSIQAVPIRATIPVAAGASLSTVLSAYPGQRLLLSPGAYDVPTSLAPAANTIIEGVAGATILRSPSSPTAAVIDINGVAGVQIKGLSIQVGGGVAASTSSAIKVRGACDGVLIEDVIADGFGTPIFVDGAAGGVAVSTVWAIEVGSNATAGTFLLGGVSPLSLGQTIYTAPIAYNATAATMQTALETIYGAGNVLVTGGDAAGTPYTVTFQAALAGLDVPLPVTVPVALAPADITPVLVSVTTRGGGPWVTDLVLRRVSASGSPANWGVGLWWCDGATLDTCTMSRNWLDGLKLAKRAENVTLLGGHCDDNGQGARSNAATLAGDGIDVFGGGGRFRMIGTTLNRNAGSGLQAKNTDAVGTSGGGVISGYGAAGWGINRVFEIVGVEARWNAAYGLALTSVSAGPSYAVRDGSIMGGDFSDNGRYGILLQVRNVTVTGAKARRNGIGGFQVNNLASYVDLIDCQAHANKVYGAFIDGDHVQLRGGMYLGVDTEGLTYDTDLALLTPVTVTNILVGANASDVLIDRPDDQYTTGGRSIEVAAGAARVTVHHRRLASGLVVGTSVIYGDVNSTAVDANGVPWRKVAGTNVAAGTWVREGGLAGSKTHDWLSLATGAEATTTVTVTGALLGDFAEASMSVSLQSMKLSAFVSAADTVTVVLRNDTGAAVDLASGTLRARVERIVG